MTYGQVKNIVDRLPFPVDSGSRPSASQVSGVWIQSSDFVNGYIGRDSDLTSNTGAVAIVTTNLGARVCHQMYRGELPQMRFDFEELVILEDKKLDDCVYLGKLGFG